MQGACHISVILVAFVWSAGGAAGATTASPSPLPGTPAIEQYVEDVPTSEGNSTAVAPTKSVRHLPTSIEAGLERVDRPTAARLRTLVKGSPYTARRDRLRGGEVHEQPTALAAAVSATGVSGDSTIVFLAVALLLVTVGAVVYAFRRQR
jgi:hypothetical protein